MLKKVRDQLLNTPKKYWIVVFGFHLHKSFWGTLLVGAGLFLHFIPSIYIGFVLILLSVTGHIYTKNKPYFKLWDREEKRK